MPCHRLRRPDPPRRWTWGVIGIFRLNRCPVWREGNNQLGMKTIAKKKTTTKKVTGKKAVKKSAKRKVLTKEIAEQGVLAGI